MTALPDHSPTADSFLRPSPSRAFHPAFDQHLESERSRG